MAPKHGFTAITSEGGLLPTDFLAELADPKSDIDGLDPVTYRLAPGERIGEQVNRSWNRLKGCWTNFQRSIAIKQPGESTTTETRERWLLPLFHELDFGRLAATKAIEIDGKSYPVSHGWASVPIHLVGSHVDLDRRTPGAVGAARMSPHSLVQQVLNASEDRMWGIISNGFMLRLLRDNVTLTRIAYVEWDLQAIFDGDLYPEFFLLWLVCHQSRFEVPAGVRPDHCWLEKWKKQAEDKGLRALENLRPGVEKAIAELGSGLVSHKANQALCSKLSKGQLTTQDFYRQILRIIYRMLFLFVAEDRGLLHPPLPKDEEKKEVIDPVLKARSRYRDFYSIGRLRDLTIHRAGTPHPDLWQVFQLVSSKLGSDIGCPELALPALGSFLWSQEATRDLNDCLVSNQYFLQAVQALAYVREGNVRRTIDYKNLGSEELGSVYESLLELHPVVNADAGTFELRTAAGHERKTTGSYYTDDSLVQCLLDSALEPVIAEAVKGKEGFTAGDALLKLKLCDPAVGSGHFLIAAGHRLAKRVAAARTGEEEPSPEAVRTALRDVIGRCLYGVDINPMAAELCRVSLWLEALEPGKPLSFLDHHMRVGNSLLGTTPELIAQGIPDGAFKDIEGDDKRACSALKRRNAAERKGIGPLFAEHDRVTQQVLQRAAATLEDLPDEKPEHIHQKAQAFARNEANEQFLIKKLLADAWCSAFVNRKIFKPGTNEPMGLTQGYLNDLAKGQQLSVQLGSEVECLAAAYGFFHWHLAFPEVFAYGGFDVVFGNPPWERVKLQEKEWFAERRPDIANAPNAATRKRLIEALRTEDPTLHTEFQDALRKADGESHLMRDSGLYPLCGRGDINVYATFAECMRRLLSPVGRVGCVLPSGIATDDTTKFFFQDVVDKKSLISLFDFENKGIFPGVDDRYKFCLFTCGSASKPSAERVEFTFFAHNVEDVRDSERRFTLSAEDIAQLNPKTRTCPIFRSRCDAELTKSLYRTNQGSEPWAFSLGTLFHSSNDADKFEDAETLEGDGWSFESTGCFRRGAEVAVPLYEGKMFALWDHRAATVVFSKEALVRQRQSAETSLAQHQDPYFSARSFFWVQEQHIERKYRWRWIVCFKKVTAPTNERTLIAALLPACAANDSIHLLFPANNGVAPDFACLLGNISSFLFDYVGRQKLGGVNFNFFVFQQLPLLPANHYRESCSWSSGSLTLRNWLLPRTLELTYTAWDLEPFAQDCGWAGPPFRWDEERRFLLRCELDAAFFHLYLGDENEWKQKGSKDLLAYFPTPRHAVDYIMDTFPIVKRKDEEKWGDYRTKRVILEIYDEITEAMRTEKPYKTRLNPPPADTRCCHPPKGGTQT